MPIGLFAIFSLHVDVDGLSVLNWVRVNVMVVQYLSIEVLFRYEPVGSPEANQHHPNLLRQIFIA